MNTTTLDQPIAEVGENNQNSLQRIWSTMRLQFVDRQWLLYTPIYILIASLALTLVVVTIIYSATGTWGEQTDGALEGMSYSWAAISPIWYIPTAAIMAINPTIHLAFAFSLSRREFYLGTVLAFLVTALFQATVVTLLWFIEKATGGYGLGARFVDSSVYTDQPWYNVFLISTLLYFIVLTISAAVAVMYLRWRIFGVLGAILALLLLLIGAATIITLLGTWESFGYWLVAQVPMFFGWVAIAGVAAIILGYLIIRRITPIN
ncbi:MAG: hypothetical protein WBA28_06645 [Microbacteriaceae bacterium]